MRTPDDTALRGGRRRWLAALVLVVGRRRRRWLDHRGTRGRGRSWAGVVAPDAALRAVIVARRGRGGAGLPAGCAGRRGRTGVVAAGPAARVVVATRRIWGRRWRR